MKKVIKLGMIVVIASAFGLVLLTQSCKKDPFQIRWGGPKNISMLPIIAEEKSFYADFNIAANHSDLQTGKLAMDGVLSGNIDIGVLVETNLAYLYFKPDSKLRIIAIVEDKHDDALLVNTKFIKSDKDFANKKIGITYGTSSQAYAMQYLLAKGVEPTSVELVNLPPPSIQSALSKEDISGGCLWQPFRYNIMQKDSNHMKLLQDRSVYTCYCLLVAREDFIKAHPSELGNFLKALIKAENYVKTNTLESQNILSREIGIPLDVFQKTWNEYDLKVYCSNKVIKSIREEGTWIKKYQKDYQTQTIPSYDSVLWPDIMSEVDKTRIE